MPPTPNALEKALQENFNHARHQETQRERYMTIYCSLWAVVLAYVGREGDFAGHVEQNKFIFMLLGIMSFATLILNLKWNAEFANHMAAAAAAATGLGLNRSTEQQIQMPNWPLSYPEFTGYMALPLKFPMPLNVGPWLSLIYCLGLALSFSLVTYGLTRCLSVSLAIGGVAGASGFAVCVVMYRHMRKAIESRAPSHGQVEDEAG
jgi:hypothetical protein